MAHLGLLELGDHTKLRLKLLQLHDSNYFPDEESLRPFSIRSGVSATSAVNQCGLLDSRIVFRALAAGIAS